jgi:hypothetical protein
MELLPQFHCKILGFLQFFNRESQASLWRMRQRTITEYIYEDSVCPVWNIGDGEWNSSMKIELYVYNSSGITFGQFFWISDSQFDYSTNYQTWECGNF